MVARGGRMVEVCGFQYKLSMTPEITESYFLNRDRLVECRPNDSVRLEGKEERVRG